MHSTEQTLHVQAYLRNGGTLASLLADYGIIAKRGRAHGSLVLLKYNQIASPMGERIVQECRGLVLDEVDDWRVVSRSFDKFFNHGEGNAASIDWASARVQEKLDGSLLTAYHYDDRWHVQTTGTPDAGGPVVSAGMIGGKWNPRPSLGGNPWMPIPTSFADYFWQILSIDGDNTFTSPCSNVPTNVCFYFELTGPLNRIVVPHDHAHLTLLGARDRVTGQEMTVDAAEKLLGHRWDKVREFPLATMADVAATFAKLSPLKQEGYVVVDAAFNRIKVKHPGYVVLHHAKDGMSTRAFVEIARSGEIPEVIAAFPELRPQLDDARGRFEQLVQEVNGDLARLRDIPEQKAFAMQATKTRCSAALFSVRAGKAPDVRSYFAGIHVDSLLKMLGYRADVAVPTADAS